MLASRFALVLTAALLALPSMAHAATIVIGPDDGPTPLETGFAQVRSGDKVVLLPGRYDERVRVVGVERVKVIGKKGAVIVSPDGAAALAFDACTRIVVQGVAFGASPGFQLELANTSAAKVRRCRFDASGGAAVRLSDGDRITVETSTFEGVDTAISSTDVTNLLVRRNEVAATRAGFGHTRTTAGASADARFERNHVTGAQFDAVNARTSRVRIVRNRIEDCGTLASLAVDADGAVVEKNVVARTQGAAVFTSSPGTRIAKNRFLDVGSSAVLTHPNANDWVVERNQVRGSGTTALFLNGNRGTAAKNKLFDTGGSAIRVNGTGGTFTGNVVQRAQGSGFLVLQGGNVFTRNRASDSTAFDYESTVPLDDNTLSGNRFATISP